MLIMLGGSGHLRGRLDRAVGSSYVVPVVAVLDPYMDPKSM